MTFPKRALRKEALASGKYSKAAWPTLAVLGSLVVVFANSFGIFRFGLYVLFGLLLILPFFNKFTTWKNPSINMPGLAFIYFSLISTAFHSATPTSVYNGTIAALSMAVLLSLVASAPKESDFRRFIRQMSIVARILLLFGLVLILSDLPFIWNTQTGFLFCLLVFILINEKIKPRKKMMYIVVWFVQSYLIDDRAYLIAGVVFGIAYLVLPVLSRRLWLGKTLLLVFLGLLILVPVFYVQLSTSVHRTYLDELALTYTGGRFFSGRDIIWNSLINDYLAGNILIGGGHDIGTSVLYGNTLSSHNTYVAVLTRMGFLGLVAFFAVFYGLLKSYLSHIEHKIVRVSAAATLALLFKQSTEFSLIGNNIAHSLFSWLVMSLGVIFINSKLRSSATNHSEVLIKKV